MIKNIVFLFLLSFSFNADCIAQTVKDSTLKNQTIEVIQSYKPEVKQAPKPVFTPDLPPRDTSLPRFQYEVPQQTLHYIYTALPLRPLALSKDTGSLLPFPNYVKLGGGNLSTIYFDAGIGSLSGKNYTTAIHLHHLSQQGNIKYQRTSFSGVEAAGYLHTKTISYSGNFGIFRNQYALYGGWVDNGVTEAPKNKYNGLEIALDAQNSIENSAGINYHPSIRAWVYWKTSAVDERNFELKLPVSKKLNENFILSASVNATITRLSITDSIAYNNNIFQFTPKIAYQKKGFAAHLGIYPTAGRNGNYILPDLFLNYKIPETNIAISGGWDARLQQNTYRQLTAYNPFLGNNFPLEQTRTDEVYGSIGVGIGNHFSFSGRISYWQLKDQPVFLNNFGIDNTFFIYYEKLIKATSFQAAINYEIADVFSARLSGTYFSYYNTISPRLWHEPALRIKADFLIRPVTGLTVTAYAAVLDGIYALNETQQQVKLRSVFDVGGGAEYSFIPRLSAFF